jgi:hypothetical protein
MKQIKESHNLVRCAVCSAQWTQPLGERVKNCDWCCSSVMSQKLPPMTNNLLQAFYRKGESFEDFEKRSMGL